ncbi:MAG: glycosyltransferase [Deltaproteobacteria bacterium]|nr:glycosyltransferase [Deltaproteobacteria bacterium]
MKGFFKDLFKRRLYQRYQEKEDRRRRLTGQLLSIIAIIVGAFYLFWHFRHINWSIWYISVPFFIAESMGWVLFASFSLVSWYPRRHMPEGVSIEKPFTVDVFVPTCGEPLDILRQTLTAAAAITYEPKTVYVLDDKASPQVAALAAELGLQYLARPEPRDAKAGNLNYGFAHSQGELILTMDADQVPHPRILERLVGYFKIPTIGFVQTKQNFIVPKGDPFGNTDKVFYNVMQCGKDGDNAAFSCGSGVIYRRRALEEIGGFSTWNVVEDVHTSMLLHQRGWRSVYYNYPLSLGTAPADIWGVYRQRGQWALDSLRLFFWDNPFFRRGLAFRQRMQYANLGFVYLVSAWFMPIFFLVPIVSILTSKAVLTASVPTYIVHRLPYFIVMALAYELLNYPTPYLHAYQMWTGLFPVFMMSTIRALMFRKDKPPYTVTSKKQVTTLKKPAIIGLAAQLAIIGASAWAIIYGVFYDTAPLDFRMLNCAWSTWSIWTLSGICIAALFRVRWAEEGPEPEKFSPGQIIQNVLALTFFLFLFILCAVMLLSIR